MLLISKKITAVILFLFVVGFTFAQRNVHFLSGTVSEKSLAELRLVQVVNGKIRPVAEYKITTGNRNFVYAIPNDTVQEYRLFVNIMKPDGRHLKVEKSFTLPLSVDSEKNYTLKIIPSALSDTKKTGWELKQDLTNPAVALISGNVFNHAIKSGLQVSLQNVEAGTLILNHSVQTNSDGYFDIACPVKKEGFYYLSTLRWRVRVYLKPSDRLQLSVDHKTGFQTSCVGSRENTALHEWQQLISPITAYGYNMGIINTDTVSMDEYVRRIQKLQPAMAGFFSKIDKSNSTFARALKNAIEVDSQFAPIHYLFYKSAQKINGYKSLPKDYNDIPDFFKHYIKPGKLSNAALLQVGEARDFMNLYTKLHVTILSKQETEKSSAAGKLKLMMNAITNDTLKSLFFADQMGSIEVNNLSEFREIFEPFKIYAKNSPAKETYNAIYGTYIEDTSFIGKSSYDFALPDSTGKMVSMKDFKGKVVLIDVWATWCGPCKAQFPFLREIEHEYAKNENLVFVGVSLDKVEVKQKWMDMIKKENLGGIQLLDDVGKSFGRKYGLSAIPRFMLIDRQGRWIEIRCPRPEAKADLKRYLDKALEDSDITSADNTSKK